MSRKRPWEMSSCVCAVCKAKRSMACVQEVDTDSYHGTGAVESLEFKVNYLTEALDALLEGAECLEKEKQT